VRAAGRTNSASSGSPAAIEWDVAMAPRIAGAVAPAALPNAKEGALTAVPADLGRKQLGVV